VATSKCPSCKGTYFEAKEKSVSNYDYKLAFIQCSNCGFVAGVLPALDTGVLAKQNQALLVGLKGQLVNLAAEVDRLRRQIRQ
jgi:hypothetical protein